MKNETKKKVDLIQRTLSPYLKENGFRRYGRTYVKFVDEDIAQVINLQNGCPQKGVQGTLWVNLGIRVPECFEHKVSDFTEKKCYQDYECNIRCRLDELCKAESGYDLSEDAEDIAGDILEKLKKYAMPVFDALDCRDAILAHRKEYADFDSMNDHLIYLEEAMIYARRGDKEKAAELFKKHLAANSNKAHSEYVQKVMAQVLDGCFQSGRINN